MFVDLTQYIWIVWLIVILVAVIIELLTLEFTFLMIAAGSLGGLAANFLGWPWWAQILVAAVLAVLLILTIRPLLLRVMRRGEDPTPSNVPALIGLSGRVLEPVDRYAGLVKLANGETWSARIDESVPALRLEQDAIVAVAAIQGSLAVVVPVPSTAPEEGRSAS